MVRSPKANTNATSTSGNASTSSASTPIITRQSSIVPAPFAQPGASNQLSPPTSRTRSRRASITSSNATAHASTSASASASGSSSKPLTASATPSSTPAPPTPTPLIISTGTPRKIKGSAVDRKSHALRSVLGEKERTACPFPGQYGGRDRCGVSDEDERDEVLMAICAACASTDNRALTPDEIAVIAIDEAWLRPPSAAVGPCTIVNNAIRAHQKRCSAAEPPRQPLLRKYQLAGSLNESNLESALHPQAFDGLARPKGTVWFLVPSGRMKWKNPFDGLDMPAPPPRKPVQPKKMYKEPKKDKEGRSEKSSAAGADLKKAPKTKTKMPPGTTPPVKIRLVLNGPPVVEEDTTSEAGSSSQGSRNVSRRPSVVSHPNSHPLSHSHSSSHTAPVLPVTIRRGSSSKRRPKTFADSSDDSATSESEMEIDGPVPSPLGLSRLSKSTSKTRKERPPPLPLNHASRHGASALSRSIGSPIVDWTHGAMASPTYTTTAFPAPLSSPFPSHSLDNTTWTSRHDRDRFAAIETSSSSSDEEMRDPIEWGSSSGILVQGSTEDLDEIKRIWTAEDEEAKVKEATDALRVLFPMSTPDDIDDHEPVIQFNQLDNRPRPAPSDTSSLAESTSTATATARGSHLKSADLAASIALTGWLPNSSPAPSPTLKSLSFANGDTSPSQHLSKLSNSFEPADMDIDEEPWLDESGELPVKAEDSLSDIDLGSTVGDTPTPEQDRQYNTAAWARDAAASSTFRIKEEPDEDYPSPLTIEPDADDASASFRASRASSSDSHTPSSRSSELPAFDIDSERLAGFDMEEVLMGPESVSLEELDGWILPGMGCRPDKTPQRAGRAHAKLRHHRGKTEGARCSGDWGSIGVGMGTANILAIHNVKSTPHRAKASKSSRRRRSSPPPAQLSTTAEDYLPTPPKEDDIKPSIGRDGDTDMEVDGIGPAELEAACAEAEAREEEHRKTLRAQREQHKALLEAYRHEVKEEHTRRQGAISPDAEPASPWPDLGGTWGSSSTESVNLTTPTPSAVPPSFLHNFLGSPPDLGALGTAGSMALNGLGVDPKALVSPPLGAITPMSEDVLSQADIDAVMRDASVPTGVKGKAGNGDGAATLPASATATSATGIGSTATTSSTGPSTTKKAAAKAKSESKAAKAKEAKAAAISVNGTAPAQNGAASASTAMPSDKDKATPPATTNANTAAPPTATAPAATAAKPRSFAKILCPGMNACVVDNIPVYSHASINKKTNKTVVVLRRLDTDFVNATGLLLALGIPMTKHQEYLNVPSQWLHSHHLVSMQAAKSGIHSPGVAGVWIPLAEAKVLEKKLKIDPTSQLANVLREDLFALFAKMAGLNQEHSPSEAFGLPFQPPARNNQLAKSSAANSKSTPNLTALSSSAPTGHLRTSTTTNAAPTAQQPPKGSLVRSAPATPPDGCPHPKRRRATIVGEANPMAKAATAATTAIGATNGSTGVVIVNQAPGIGANGAAASTNANGTATSPVKTGTANGILKPNGATSTSPVNVVMTSPTKTNAPATKVEPKSPTAAKLNSSATSTTSTPIKKPPPRAARPGGMGAGVAASVTVEAKVAAAK